MANFTCEACHQPLEKHHQEVDETLSWYSTGSEPAAVWFVCTPKEDWV